MASTLEKVKTIPDSHFVIQKKTLAFIKSVAQTKFLQSLVTVTVNREEEYFEVIVKDATEIHITEFETMWPMCKVQALKSVPRKK